MLAGGDVQRVINAMIAANKANIELPWQTATAIDLAGRAYAEVQAAVELDPALDELAGQLLSAQESLTDAASQLSSRLGDLVGQVFAMFVLTVAAGEAAIGLAILVIYFRGRGTIAVDDANRMKG